MPKSPLIVSKDVLLQVMQPATLGAIDGGVSSLSPLFAVFFLTHQSFATFIVGMSVATGSGISMAMAEALSDDGKLSGRGSPFKRGAIMGGATFLGATFHSLPFLIRDAQIALYVALVVVFLELLAIAIIRHMFFKTPVALSMLQVFLGGLLVIAAGFLFGSA